MKFTDFFKIKQGRDDPVVAAQIKAATEVALEPQERALMRAHLSEYMKIRPIRSPISEERVSQAPAYWRAHTSSVFAAALMLALGVSTASAAETALPGDILYPVKVHVTEEVRAALMSGPKDKANWAVDRASRRLQEAATLAVQGKLTARAQAEINSNFEEHLKTAIADRVELEGDNDLAAATEIETNIGATLRAHEEVLDSVRAKLADGDNVKAHVEAVIDSVHIAAGVSTDKETRLENKIKEGTSVSVGAVAKDKRSSAKAKIDNTKDLLVRTQKRLNAQAKAQAQGQLKVAREAFEAGERSDARGDKAGAFSDFSTALRTAVETSAFVAGGVNVADSSEHRDRSDEDEHAISATTITTTSSSSTTINATTSSELNSGGKIDLGN